MKRILTIISLACLGISALISVLAIFNVFDFSGIPLSILFTLLTILSASILLNNIAKLLEQKNIFSILISVLIGISAILFLIVIWAKNLNDNFLKITVVFSFISIFANIVVSNILKLNKKLLWLQIPAYITLAYVELVITLLVFDNKVLYENMTALFFAVVIITISLLVALSILSRKYEDNINYQKDKITISIEEYEGLKREIAELKEKLNNKSNN